MNLNAIPFLGWFLSLVFTISLAVPFYIVWGPFGIGETYFYFLPEVYRKIGFWDTVWLFLALGILKSVLPVFSSASSSSNSGK